MKQDEYDRQYDYNRQEDDSWLLKKVKNFGAVRSKDGFKKAVLRRIPVITWIKNYLAVNLMSDIAAGVTVGVYNVPQAMSYATLAGLTPVYGLYASFFPPLLYAIFGTAKHTSIGVFAITCLMVNKCIQKMMKIQHGSQAIVLLGNTTTEVNPPVLLTGLTPVQIATSLCMLTGLVQALMAIIRCDKMMKFLSAPAISAFVSVSGLWRRPIIHIFRITFSACFFGVVSQIPKMMGFSVDSKNHRYFNLYYSCCEIVKNIHNTNLVTFGISIFCFTFLVGAKWILEPRLKKYPIIGNFPFPKELVVIITGTTISYFMDLEKNYGVKIINDVPRGFPAPSFPRVDLWPFITQDAISIAVVAYAVTISMGQIFSKKHKYKIDSNQELLALGLINIGSSMFSTFPTSTSLSRTLVNEECGAKTQLSGMVSCCVILLVITIVGPLLSTLPSCILACIVIVVVHSMLVKCKELPKLWKYSKHDFWIWVLTALVTLASDIAEGVAAGIFFAIITIAIQSQQPTIKQLGQVRINDFRPINHYGLAKETSFRIIRFDAPLIFANVDKFLDNVRDAASAKQKQRSASTDSQEDGDWTAIILDCHTWIYTDSMGIDAVKEIDEDLKNMRILLLFANLKSSLRRQYEDAGVLEQISQRQIYPSIQDALDSAHALVADQKTFFDAEKAVQTNVAFEKEADLA